MRALLPTLALAIFVLPLAAQKTAKPAARPKKQAPEPTLDARERALQMLDRFTYGPRPGDLEHVIAMTPLKWFEQQLNPAAINDDALNKRLAQYPTLTMTPEQALDVFPTRGMMEQVRDKKRAMPVDPLEAGLYEVQLYKLNAEKVDPKNPVPELTEEQKAAQKKLDQATAMRIAGELLALPKAQRMAALMKEQPEDRMTFVRNAGGEQKSALQADFTPRERETFTAMESGESLQYLIPGELSQAKVLRSVLSERQLQEVMTDFWFNHFNVYAPKDSDQWYTTSYERDVIRPRALGKFRDLLLATAESPAMMVYLDNWLSIGPDSLANGVNPANPKAKRGNKGLNENYGREVMELHTVGVNGGYTQGDVTELSAILTGWGVDNPNKPGGFFYDPRRHEPGPKQWFGYTIDDQGRILNAAPGKPGIPVAAQQAAAQAEKDEVVRPDPNAPGYLLVTTSVPPDGMKQGVTALTLLAASPKTAHFISYQLAQQFLADDPPDAVVDRMAAAYLASDGDIRTVLRTLVASPEFSQKRYFRNKMKTPVEFVASAFRTTATDPQNPGALVNTIKQMGEPLYGKLEPTGYRITADHWMNTSALIDRLNFADQLTHNRFANQKFDAAKVLAFGLLAEPVLPAVNSTQPAGFTETMAQPRAVTIADRVSVPAPAPSGTDLALQVLEKTIIGAPVSSHSDDYIRAQMAKQAPGNPADTLNLLTALILGSPDFQLR